MAIITAKKRRMAEVVTAKICDRCAMQATATSDGFPVEFNEFRSIRWRAGYGSVLTDGDTYQVDLCQKCTKELLGPYSRIVAKGHFRALEVLNLDEIFGPERKKRSHG